MNATPPAIPLTDIFNACLAMQLREQTAAARLDLEKLPETRLDGFRALLFMESRKRTPSLAVYCLAFPDKAAAAIHEAATATVAETIKTFFSATTAQ